MPKLAIADLGKRFGDLEVLRGIDLAVERGEFIALVGPSGCGKTTFLRMVAGLEPASSGEVLLDDRAVRGPGADRGFVFQSDNLLPWRTVFANAIIGREIAGRVGPAERRRTMELLKLVGLEGFEHYHPRQLSGGMRQRVNLARALAIDPQILLMDEPSLSRNPRTREISQTELMRIWEDGRKTVLFVTHQIDEAVFLADRVLVFARRPGRLRENVAIALPRPRALAIKRTAEFVRYVDHIWRLIEDDVRASVIEEKVRSFVAVAGKRSGGTEVACSASACFTATTRLDARVGGAANWKGPYDRKPHHATAVFDDSRGFGCGCRNVSDIRARAAELSQPSGSVRAALRRRRRRRHHRPPRGGERSEEHTSELQSLRH